MTVSSLANSCVSRPDFDDYVKSLHPAFGNQRQHPQAKLYLEGLLAAGLKRNIETVSLNLSGANYTDLHYFVSRSRGEHTKLIELLQGNIDEEAGDPDGILYVDESGFPKRGKKSVGVARQYCGNLGKVDNCQVGVFLGYAQGSFYNLADERLYLPKGWTDDRGRCKQAGVPDEVQFKTKPQLALDMIREARPRIPHGWVTADEGYGGKPWFLEALHDDGERYILQVPENTGVICLDPNLGMTHPQKLEVRQIAPRAPDHLWKVEKFRDGQKGPDLAKFLLLRVKRTPCNCSDAEAWLLIRKSIDDADDIRYYLSNADDQVSLVTLASVASERVSVEQCFKECNSEAGMDHYQMRVWRGWHHHMTLTIAAQLFLSLGRQRMLSAMPTITVRQVGMIVQNFLRRTPNDLPNALRIVTHWQDRIAEAHSYHRAKRVAELRARGYKVA